MVSDSTCGRVRVTIRLRPPSRDELSDPDYLNCINIDGTAITVLKDSYQGSNTKSFVFDQILSHSCTQSDTYAAVAKPVVDDVLEGYNGTILAYGQTGTGKTHTLANFDPENAGIIPRVLEHIFTAAQQDQEHEINVSLSYLQLYMEVFQDLLFPDTTGIAVREDPETGVFIQNCSRVKVNSTTETLLLLEAGNRNRVTSFTSMNAQSSRSHAIAIVYIEKRKKLSRSDLESTETLGDRTVITSKLFLVDLAGSERIKKTNVSGVRQEEAKSINLSLSSLGNVVSALADPLNKHVPYRDSKLTRLLMDSLGGNSKTAMVVCIGPAAYNSSETINSLRFAERATLVKVDAKKNVSIDYRALSMQLQAKLDEKEDEISRLKIKLGSLERKVNNYKKLYGEVDMTRIDSESDCDDVIDLSGSELERLKRLVSEAENRANLAYDLAEKQLQSRISDLSSENEELRLRLESTQSRFLDCQSELSALQSTLSQQQDEFAESFAVLKSTVRQEMAEMEETYTKTYSELMEKFANERNEIENKFELELNHEKEKYENNLLLMKKIHDNQKESLQNTILELERVSVVSDQVDDLRAEKFAFMSLLRKIEVYFSKLRLELLSNTQKIQSPKVLDPSILKSSEVFINLMGGVFHDNQSINNDYQSNWIVPVRSICKSLLLDSVVVKSSPVKKQSFLIGPEVNHTHPDSFSVASSVISSILDTVHTEVSIMERIRTHIDPHKLMEGRALYGKRILSAYRTKSLKKDIDFGISIDSILNSLINSSPCSSFIPSLSVPCFSGLDSLLVSDVFNEAVVDDRTGDDNSDSDSCSASEFEEEEPSDELYELALEIDTDLNGLLGISNRTSYTIPELEALNLLNDIDSPPSPCHSLLLLSRLTTDRLAIMSAEGLASAVTSRRRAIANAMGLVVFHGCLSLLDSIKHQRNQTHLHNSILESHLRHFAGRLLHEQCKFKCLSLEFKSFAETSNFCYDQLKQDKSARVIQTAFRKFLARRERREMKCREDKTLDTYSSTGLTLFNQTINSVCDAFDELINFFVVPDSCSFSRFEDASNKKGVVVDTLNPLRLRQLRALDSPRRKLSLV
ncbi:hypothetical protein RCL1_000865 [Eukaryota sp. TZLM3-RCL]